MVVGDSGFPHQLLQQHLAKASRMRDRQADVFVEMKSFHLRPVDLRRLGNSIQKFELRRSRRSNDPCVAMLGDGAANGRRRLLRSRTAPAKLLSLNTLSSMKSAPVAGTEFAARSESRNYTKSTSQIDAILNRSFIP